MGGIARRLHGHRIKAQAIRQVALRLHLLQAVNNKATDFGKKVHIIIPK
jgi:hypothetical protein